jgi:aminomethyltransferase
MLFMTMRKLHLGAPAARPSPLGYTGEDGYEISVPGAHRDGLSRASLLADADVLPSRPRRARQTCALEAGLCLYGHDVDEATTPDRGRPRLGHRQAPQARQGLPRRRPHPRPAFQRYQTRARGAQARRQGARTRGCRNRGRQRHRRRPRDLGWLRPQRERSRGHGYVSPDYAKDGTALGLKVRTQVLPAASSPCPSSPRGSTSHEQGKVSRENADRASEREINSGLTSCAAGALVQVGASRRSLSLFSRNSRSFARSREILLQPKQSTSTP